MQHGTPALMWLLPKAQQEASPSAFSRVVAYKYVLNFKTNNKIILKES